MSTASELFQIIAPVFGVGFLVFLFGLFGAIIVQAYRTRA